MGVSWGEEEAFELEGGPRGAILQLVIYAL